MIADVHKGGAQASDAAAYARYCISPKPGDTDYKHGERVLLVECDGFSPGLIPDANDKDACAAWSERLGAELESWTITQRAGKTMPKSMFQSGSFSFSAEDSKKLTPEQAKEIALAAIKEVMPGNRPSMITVHGDTECLHVHFVAATVDDAGKIWNPRFDYRLWELACERLEKEHGLERVMQRRAVAERDKNAAREVLVKAPSAIEIQRAAREQTASPKETIKYSLQEAVKNCPSLEIFADRIELAGVKAKPFVRDDGTAYGLAFALASEPDPVWISGSQFGSSFGFAKLTKKVCGYDKDRDAAIISRWQHGASQQLTRTSGYDFSGIKHDARADRADIAANQIDRIGVVGAASEAFSIEFNDDFRRFNRDINSTESGSTGAEQTAQPAATANDSAMAAGTSASVAWVGEQQYSVNKNRENTESNNSGSENRSEKTDEVSVGWRGVDWDNSGGAYDDVIALSAPTSNQPKRTTGGILSTAHAGGDMQTDRTEEAVKNQLRAMGCKGYIVGVYDHKTGAMFENRWTQEEVLKAIRRLKRWNAQDKDVWIKPDDSGHDLIVLDDLSFDDIEQMQNAGHEPALTIETSPNNYQAIVKLGTELQDAERAEISRTLCAAYDADKGATGKTHYCRLAGFTNRKPEHKNEANRSPFALLRNSSGKTAGNAKQLLNDARMEIEKTALEAEKTARNKAIFEAVPASNAGKYYGSAETAYMLSYKKHYAFAKQQFQSGKWRSIDANVIDFRAACDLLKSGFNAGAVADAVAACSPNISERKKQHAVSYAQRTVQKAVAEPDVSKAMAEQQRQQRQRAESSVYSSPTPWG